MVVAWSDVVIILYSVTDARSYEVAQEIFHTIQNNLFTYVSISTHIQKCQKYCGSGSVPFLL